jgi:hypothetical protein
MKCLKHPLIDAVAVCVHCGAAVCLDCVQSSTSHKIVCSEACAKGLAETELTLATIRRKTQGGHQLTGYFCCGVALVLGVFAVLSGVDKQWLVAALQGLLALGLGLTGFFYVRLAKTHEVDR